jgi:hypothetical protein
MFAATTLTGAVPVTPDKAALTVEVPADMPVTMPVLLTVATAGADEVQVTEEETSEDVPSLKAPVATNLVVPLTESVGDAGARVIPVRELEPDEPEEPVPVEPELEEPEDPEPDEEGEGRTWLDPHPVAIRTRGSAKMVWASQFTGRDKCERMKPPTGMR